MPRGRRAACSGMRHYDVQLIGGMVLHRGGIAEMRPARARRSSPRCRCYLNALEGKGVHVVTVNDYLASRDAEWMGRIYKFLGLSRRHRRPRPDRPRAPAQLPLRHHLRPEQRVRLRLPARQHEVLARALRAARAALRDRRRGRLDPHRRGAHAAHHLRPGRGSRPTCTTRSTRSSRACKQGHRLHRRREGALGDRSPTTASSASRSCSNVGNLYDPVNIESLHHVTQALRAHTLYKRDVNYLVEEGKVLIIDEFTGRKMPGRRWSDGLHQAVEAKEDVTRRGREPDAGDDHLPELFRIYKKLARHDRHRRHRGGRVPRDLQARRHA